MPLSRSGRAVPDEPIDHTFLPPGRLATGANYWASHAGPGMWSDRKPSVVRADFEVLSAAGLNLLRIFPLWPEFQPIHQLRRGGGVHAEYRHDETPLEHGPLGQSGVSVEMLGRLREVADLASEHGIQLIVGLVTGWMSGRLFVPPALNGLNHITDPVSIMWQVRLAKAIVGALRDHSAIVGWDLGNECNVMGDATAEQAWVWTSTLADAIRSADPTRSVISGMHSLAVDPAQPWSIQSQGELTDWLTTHPYPIFTAHCNREPIDTMRPLLHATAETCLYRDLSGKPAFIEEFGSLGPMFCNSEAARAFVRVSLFNYWAHDCRAALWWCAFDQGALESAPHDWVAMERELGLFAPDGTPKEIVEEMKAVRAAIGALPPLRPRRVDAVCLLSRGQDQWGAAYSCFLLAKQAGFDLRFHFGDAPLPDAALYLVPSLNGLAAITRRQELQLREKVAAGASAYLSFGDGYFTGFSDFTGLEVRSRHQTSEARSFRLSDEPAADVLRVASNTHLALRTCGATALAEDAAGSPVFAAHTYGKGKVYVLAAPLESALAAENEAFMPDKMQPWWKIYRRIAADVLRSRCVRKASPWIGITEHATNDGAIIAVLINHSPIEVEDQFIINAGVSFDSACFGSAPLALSHATYTATLAPHGVAVWSLEHA